MANNIKGITIEIGGSTQKLDQALKGVNTTAKSLQNELKAVNTALKLDPTNVEAAAKKQQLLTEAGKTTKEKLDPLKTAQEQAQAAFERGEMGEEKYREYRQEKRKSRGQDSNTFKGAAEKNLQEINLQISQKTAKLDGINAQIAEAKNIVMTADIPPRPEVKELPENPTRKQKKEHEKELQAAKEWDDKYKLLQAAQITANANAAERQELKDGKLKLKQKVDETNMQIREFKNAKAELNKEKNKFNEEKKLFKKNKTFIIAAEAQRRAEHILESYGIRPDGYGIDEQIQQAQRAAEIQEQKGKEK